MAHVVIAGGGMNGLSAGLLLAGDGHEVTVLERDPAPPPAGDEAWDGWERRSVGQFRMLHYLHPGWRAVAEAELPEAVTALERAGALRFNIVDHLPRPLVGERRPEDDDLTTLTGRRPVLEAAIAGLADATPGLTVRRGAALAGLVTGTPTSPGVPHVTGVTTEAGDVVTGDLVVDATGRRSPLLGWLESIGAHPPVEEQEDLGFQYYGRHFRSRDGALPELVAPLLQPYEGVSILTLPADHGTWGVGFITSSRDRDLRPLRDDDTWMRALRAFPLAAHWADAEPLDHVAVMTNLPDRHRRLVVDGSPVVTGLLALGDAWACTNPSLGRGITMGLMHAVALRDLLRSGHAERPGKLALAWDDVSEATVGPWYRGSLEFDRHRLAAMDAAIRGEDYRPEDPQFEISSAMLLASTLDGDVLRSVQRFVGMLQSIDATLAAPGFLDRVIELGAGWRDTPPAGPTRAQLLRLLAG